MKSGSCGRRIAQPEISLGQIDPRQFEPRITLEGILPEGNGATVVPALRMKRPEVYRRNNLCRSRVYRPFIVRDGSLILPFSVVEESQLLEHGRIGRHLECRLLEQLLRPGEIGFLLLD